MTDTPIPTSAPNTPKPLPSVRTLSRADLQSMVHALRKENDDLSMQLAAHRQGMERGNQYATQLATIAHNCLLLSYPEAWEHPIIVQYAKHFDLNASNVEERKAALLAEIEKGAKDENPDPTD